MLKCNLIIKIEHSSGQKWYFHSKEGMVKDIEQATIFTKVLFLEDTLERLPDMSNKGISYKLITVS